MTDLFFEKSSSTPPVNTLHRATPALAAPQQHSLFLCGVVAVEKVNWLMETPPRIGKAVERFLNHLENSNNKRRVRIDAYDPLKLATRLPLQVINYLGDEVMKVFRAD